MTKKIPVLAKGVAIVLVNLIIFAGLLAGLEIYLRLNDLFLRLPFDTSYYKNNRQYYPDLIVPPSVQDDYISWGSRVEENRFGFREREFDRPKAGDTCRIMILGDSFTWGAGLDLDERYGNLVEERLQEAFPDQKIEVVSWARQGWTTVMERDMLRAFDAWLQPDFIVVAYVLNDPQVKYQGTTPEKIEFYQKHGEKIKTGLGWLIRAGLPRTAKMVHLALDNFLVKSGFLPPWEAALQKTYERDSAEWQAFEQALRDIKGRAEEMNQPAPLFIVLNQDNFWTQPTEVSDLDPSLPIYLRWYHQAEQAAMGAGFRTYNHEKELLEQVSREEIPVNKLDFHPSARVNQIYADKLFATLAEDIRQGQLCQPGQLRGTEAATAAPLVEERLLSVRFGPQIRFLGYVAETQKLAEERTLQLSLGWQALEEIPVNYTLVLELVDGKGKVWQRQEGLPCGGDCLTLFWPEGLIAPPDPDIVYWPEEWEILPVPLGELPSQRALRDIHLITFKPEIPEGEYLLTLGLYDRDKQEYLPTFDEVSYTSPLEGRAILGTIILPDER